MYSDQLSWVLGSDQGSVGTWNSFIHLFERRQTFGHDHSQCLDWRLVRRLPSNSCIWHTTQSTSIGHLLKHLHQSYCPDFPWTLVCHHSFPDCHFLYHLKAKLDSSLLTCWQKLAFFLHFCFVMSSCWSSRSLWVAGRFCCSFLCLFLG